MFLLTSRECPAYVEIPYTLGRLVQESTHVMLLRVEKVDKTKNLIIYRKIKDIKGTHPTDVIRHNIGQAGFSPREWQTIMAWAEEGKTAVFMHNGGASETCIDGYWYQAYANGEWWGMSHAEPYMNRSFFGKPEKLAPLVQAMLAGQEVVTTCLVDGDKQALQLGTAKVQRLKASLKIQDYDPKRDFLGWGGNEDFRKLAGMPGFSHLCELPRVDPGASGIAAADFDGNGKPDFCLFGDARVSLLTSDGKALSEFSLPYSGGARSAEWGDYNADGKPDLLLATTAGPRLLTNAGDSFKDGTGLLPPESYYNLAGAAWVDADGDKQLDVVLANGLLGWRVYHHLGAEAQKQAADPASGKWHYAGPFDNTGGVGFEAKYPPEAAVDLKAEYQGKGGAAVKWKEGAFTDGKVNSLNLFPDNNNCVAYLYREFNIASAVEVPASFGSDDSLQVWLNGNKLISENVARAASPDSSKAVLKLKAGRNKLLLKIGQGTGDFAFYFKADLPPDAPPPLFADATETLAAELAALPSAGGYLATADFNADGRADLLLAGRETTLALGTPQGFKRVKDHGLDCKAATGRPALGDFDGDKLPDVFVPTAAGGRLYRSLGKGHFVDVTDRAGDLASAVKSSGTSSLPMSAAWADLDNSGKPGLLLGCIKGPNRYYRHQAGSRFADATEELGLHQKVFNTRAAHAADLNGDGACDLLLNNEAQASVALLGVGERIASPSDIAR